MKNTIKQKLDIPFNNQLSKRLISFAIRTLVNQVLSKKDISINIRNKEIDYTSTGGN